MINGINGSNISQAYTNMLKDSQKKGNSQSSKDFTEINKDKIKLYKEKIESGEIKIDIQALAEKIAKELL